MTGKDDRRPAHDLDAEASVLGAAMLDPEAHALVAGLGADVWYKPAHRHVADALRTLHANCTPADPVTVVDELRRTGNYDAAGGHQALLDVMAQCPATSSAPAHARIVTDCATKRRLAAIAGEVEAMASNGHDAHDALGQARRLIDQLAADVDHDTDSDATVGEKKAAATLLVEIATQLYTFGVSADGDAFAVPLAGPRVVSMLRGGKPSLRALLAREYFGRYRRAAPQQALADALLVIEGTAQETTEQPLGLRVARTADGALWLDLADDLGTAVKITPAGWDLAQDAPVLFRRTTLTAALPVPEHGGELAELWEFLNVEDDDRPLLAAWLVSALWPDIPHPTLGLFGEQGTGKSTAMKLVVQLVDATPVPARKPPRDPDSWVTAAAGSWVVGLDNLSDITPWLSDSICRAVTGDGDVRRQLYSDGDLVVFAFKRCVVFNGIDLGGLRGDLADRLVPIHLQRIDDTARRDEEALWPAWRAAQPRILGALLDLTAQVAKTLPDVVLPAKPRMADFARILATVDHVLGTAGYTRYLDIQADLATDSLSGDDFVTALRAALDGEPFEDVTSADLLAKVTPTDSDWRRPKHWPNNARAVTTLLHRQAPVMRKAGWTVDDDNGANRQSVVRWTITPPRDGPEPDPRDPRNPRQPPDQAQHAETGAGQTAGHAGHTDPADPRHQRPAPRNPRDPRPDPRPNSREHAGHSTDAGHAGHAGQKPGHLSPRPAEPATGWAPDHPCIRCSAEATDVSGLCADCIATHRRPREEF